MKYNKTYILTILSALALIFIPAAPALATGSGGSITLSTSKSTVSVGSEFIVAVYMNGGGNPINAIEADLNYPSSELEYVGINYSGSAFSINTPTNGGGSGAVSIQNGSITPVSGAGLLATVTFKALASSGRAAIGVSGSSNLINANDNTSVAYSSSGTSVTLSSGVAAPVVSTSHVSSSTSDATPAAAAVAAPAPPKDTTPPVVSDLKITNLTPFSATISWTTNEPSDSAVDYGLDPTYGLSASTSTLSTSHNVALSSSFLIPKTTLHYRVKSTDASGNVQIGTDQAFQLPGIPVVITVIGTGGKPQAGASVTLDNETGTTDAKGIVTLSSGTGEKQIVTTFGGVSVKQSISVGKNSKALTNYKLDLAKQPVNRWMVTSAGLAVIILALIALDAILFGSRIFARLLRIKTTHHLGLPVHATASAASQYVPKAPDYHQPHSKPDPIIPSSMQHSSESTAIASPPTPPTPLPAPPSSAVEYPVLKHQTLVLKPTAEAVVSEQSAVATTTSADELPFVSAAEVPRTTPVPVSVSAQSTADVFPVVSSPSTVRIPIVDQDEKLPATPKKIAKKPRKKRATKA